MISRSAPTKMSPNAPATISKGLNGPLAPALASSGVVTLAGLAHAPSPALFTALALA
jgi:hypothetical protein